MMVVFLATRQNNYHADEGKFGSRDKMSRCHAEVIGGRRRDGLVWGKLNSVA